MKFILLFLLAITLLFAEDRDRIRPQYTYLDSSIAIEYLFETDVSDSLIIATIFEYEHIKQYAGKTNLNILLIDTLPEKNRILYKYNYFAATLGVTMERVRVSSQGKVKFTMSAYSRSNLIIPDIKSVTGEYLIIKRNGSTFVQYSQETIFREKPHIFLKMLLKRDTRRFLREYIKYLDSLSPERELY